MANKLFQNVALTAGLVAGLLNAAVDYVRVGIFSADSLYGGVIVMAALIFIGDFLADLIVKRTPALPLRAVFPTLLFLAYVALNFGMNLALLLMSAVSGYIIFLISLGAAAWLERRY